MPPYFKTVLVSDLFEKILGFEAKERTENRVELERPHLSLHCHLREGKFLLYGLLDEL